MPQASEELRAQFKDDGQAWKALGKNFKDKKGLITRIDKSVLPTHHQLLAISYLCHEWDYAWEGATVRE